MKKLFVTIPEGDVRNTFLPPEIRKMLEEKYSVEYNNSTEQLTSRGLCEALFDADAVLTGWGTAMIDKEVIECAKRLKLIVHTGGTVGNLVDSAVYERGITVLSGNRLYAESVAEGVLCYMMCAMRRIPDYINTVRAGGWRSEADIWEGLFDRTVGIVGLGTISTILIGFLQSFRVKIKIFSHYPIDKKFLEENNCEAASLDEIFSECDIVSIHSALNAENRGLIGKKHFDMLRDGALFINTSRGAVIDEAALCEALEQKRFRAVLDVYNTEPLARDSRLRVLDNVYCIPHMAGPTLDRRPRITARLIEEMTSFFEGGDYGTLEITKELAARMTKM